MEYKLNLKIVKEYSEDFEEENVLFSEFGNDERKKSQVHWLYKNDDINKPSAAIVKYEAGGCSPNHFHSGFELIYMLDGEMTTSQGKVKKGDIIYYDPNTNHSFYTETGCVSLITWGAQTIPSKEGRASY